MGGFFTPSTVGIFLFNDDAICNGVGQFAIQGDALYFFLWVCECRASNHTQAITTKFVLKRGISSENGIFRASVISDYKHSAVALLYCQFLAMHDFPNGNILWGKVHIEYSTAVYFSKRFGLIDDNVGSFCGFSPSGLHQFVSRRVVNL